jgi:single-strand DNA-binding protein
MQKFTVIGNIGSDLDLRETSSGTSMVRFSVAVKRNYTRGDGERETDWFDCVAYRNTAESICKYCNKGDKIYLEGTIEIRSYEDNQGIKRKAIDVIVDKTEFLATKKAQPQTQEEQPKRKPTLLEMDDTDDFIPF